MNLTYTELILMRDSNRQSYDQQRKIELGKRTKTIMSKAKTPQDQMKIMKGKIYQNAIAKTDEIMKETPLYKLLEKLNNDITKIENQYLENQ